MSVSHKVFAHLLLASPNDNLSKIASLGHNFKILRKKFNVKLTVLINLLVGSNRISKWHGRDGNFHGNFYENSDENFDRNFDENLLEGLNRISKCHGRDGNFH